MKNEISYRDRITELEEERDKAQILLEAAREAVPLTAIAFGEWLGKNYHSIYNGKDLYWGSYSGSYTTEKLYQIFINSKN